MFCTRVQCYKGRLNNVKKTDNLVLGVVPNNGFENSKNFNSGNTEFKNALSSKVFRQLSSTQLAAMSKLARSGVIKVEPAIISA